VTAALHDFGVAVACCACLPCKRKGEALPFVSRILVHRHTCMCNTHARMSNTYGRMLIHMHMMKAFIMCIMCIRLSVLASVCPGVLYTHTHQHTHTHTHTRTRVCICVSMCVSAHACACVYVGVRMFVWLSGCVGVRVVAWVRGCGCVGGGCMFMHTHLAETMTRENHIRAHRNSPPDKPRPPAIITLSRAHIHSHTHTHTHRWHKGKRRRRTYRGRGKRVRGKRT
jgi:hypothetical protein